MRFTKGTKKGQDDEAAPIAVRGTLTLVLYGMDQTLFCLMHLSIFWSRLPGLNRRPSDWKSEALPTELSLLCYLSAFWIFFWFRILRDFWFFFLVLFHIC